jgi:hypothetical protein
MSLMSHDAEIREEPQPAGATVGSGARRSSMAGFLVALLLFIFATPFLQELPGGDTIEGALLTLVLLTAVPAIGARRRTLIIAVILVIPALLGKWIHHFRPDLVPQALLIGFVMLFVAFVVAHLLRFILRARQVDAEVLCAGVAGFFMIGLLWSIAYLLVSRMQPGSFSISAGASGAVMDGFNAIYFSFVNLSTVGFGDIVPLSRIARMLAVAEATVGMFYMAILIARLVSLYSSEKGTTS